MRKIFTLGAMLLVSITMLADEVVVNGIHYYYEEWSDTPTATVISNEDGYKGDIKIPSSIKVDGKTIPVTCINQWAFDGSAITSVYIPKSITGIFQSAFGGCSGLTKVTFEEGCKPTELGPYLFNECTGLKSITIPEGWTIMPEGIFIRCASLESITLPSTLTTIESDAFYGCAGLQSIKIPNTVTSIGNSAFGECAGLTSITIPNLVATIGSSAFSGCTGLTSMIIPNNVTSLGSWAFDGCTNLQEVSISNKVSVIGASTFAYCENIKEIRVPNSVTEIEEKAFESAKNLKTLYIGEGVRKIGLHILQGAENLDKVYCYAQKVPTCELESFAYIKEEDAPMPTLYVPSALINSYKANEGYAKTFNIEVMDESSSKICATPTISFVNGLITFACETPGAKFHYKVSAEGETGESISTPYVVSVYATAEGYVRSATASETINITTTAGDMDGDGQITIADITGLIDAYLGK